MARFEKGVDWPIMMIVGFLAEAESFDWTQKPVGRTELARLAMLLTLREAGESDHELKEYFQPNSARLDLVAEWRTQHESPLKHFSYKVWQWRGDGLCLLIAGCEEFMRSEPELAEEIRLHPGAVFFPSPPRYRKYATRNTKWLEIVKKKIATETKMEQEAIRRCAETP